MKEHAADQARKGRHSESPANTNVLGIVVLYLSCLTCLYHNIKASLLPLDFVFLPLLILLCFVML